MFCLFYVFQACDCKQIYLAYQTIKIYPKTFFNLFFITANISQSTTLALVFLLLQILSNTPLYHTDFHVLHGEQIWLEP